MRGCVNPTAKSLQLLRQRGYIANRVGTFVRFRNGVRLEPKVFGFTGILAFGARTVGCLAVHITSLNGLSETKQRLRQNKRVKAWLKARNRLELHAWGAVGRGGRKKWDVKIVSVRPVKKQKKKVA